MIQKFIRNIKVKKYLKYFKSEYPDTYIYLNKSEFNSEKDRYFHIKTLYTLYKSHKSIWKDYVNYNYQYSDYTGNVIIDIDLSNNEHKFNIKTKLIYNKIFKFDGDIKIENKKINKIISIDIKHLDKKVFDSIEIKIKSSIDPHSFLKYENYRREYKEHKRDYGYTHDEFYNAYNNWKNKKTKSNSETETKSKSADKSFERFKKLVLNLKERKRQIDNMDKNDPNYSTLVNEYNTGVRRWRSMKEKYNY